MALAAAVSLPPWMIQAASAVGSPWCQRAASAARQTAAWRVVVAVAGTAGRQKLAADLDTIPAATVVGLETAHVWRIRERSTTVAVGTAWLVATQRTGAVALEGLAGTGRRPCCLKACSKASNSTKA